MVSHYKAVLYKHVEESTWTAGKRGLCHNLLWWWMDGRSYWRLFVCACVCVVLVPPGSTMHSWGQQPSNADKWWLLVMCRCWSLGKITSVNTNISCCFFIAAEATLPNFLIRWYHCDQTCSHVYGLMKSQCSSLFTVVLLMLSKSYLTVFVSPIILQLLNSYCL